MTVVGECLGAGEKEEAVYYIKKISIAAEVVLIATCLLMFGLTYPITYFGGMEPGSAKLCIFMVTCITIVKPIVWIGMFTDWTIRGIIYTIRFKNRKWLAHQVI